MPRGIYARTKETGKKISEALKGRASPFKGRKHSEETKRKISENGFHLGMLGKKHSEEAKIKMSQSKIGNQYSKGRKLTEEQKKKLSLIKTGVPRTEEMKSKMRGNKNWNWKGGKFIDGFGYVHIRRLNYPFAINGCVREHRLVIEEARKITLNPWMIVHHINGIKNDNRLENLRVMSKGEHTTLHNKCRSLK